jgi:hypothetical protein
VITGEELEDLVDRLLEVGVPPTAVAKAYGIEPLAVKDRLNELRVEQYGSAELSEATTQMQWEALAQARAMIYEAPYNVRSRFIMAILSKTMSLTARQNPETVGNMRRDLLELMHQEVGVGDVDHGAIPEPEVPDPDAFVVTAPADEDQDQGPDR